MSQVIIMATIIIYLVAVVIIGVVCSKKNNAVTQVDIANQSNTDRMMVSKVLRTFVIH